MQKIKIFISSVQTEFKNEREALKNYIYGDPLLREFFQVFLFEYQPAIDIKSEKMY